MRDRSFILPASVGGCRKTAVRIRQHESRPNVRIALRHRESNRLIRTEASFNRERQSPFKPFSGERPAVRGKAYEEPFVSPASPLMFIQSLLFLRNDYELVQVLCKTR